MFLKKLPFKGQKMIFSPKQKLFQIPLAIVKQVKNYFFQKKYFWGVLGIPKYGVFGVFCYFWDP